MSARFQIAIVLGKGTNLQKSLDNFTHHECFVNMTEILCFIGESLIQNNDLGLFKQQSIINTNVVICRFDKARVQAGRKDQYGHPC